MHYQIACVSLLGDRETNEDFAAYTAIDGGMLAVVCDGLGGHARGEWASRAFAESIIASAADLPLDCLQSRDSARAFFQRAFSKGKNNIAYKLALEKSDDNPKTTAVVAAAHSSGIAIAHLGDSRAYRVASGSDPWRTRDHSVVQLLLDQEEISEEEMGHHQDQGKLFKSISARGDDAPSVTIQPPLRSGEALLLCSDGFWEQVTRLEQQSLLHTPDLQSALKALAEAAVVRAKGSSDNVTAICMRPQGR